MMRDERCPIGTRVQTYLLCRRVFRSLLVATKWAREHGVRKVHPTPRFFRVRVAPPDHFLKGSFRTITLGHGVEAVVGCPRG